MISFTFFLNNVCWNKPFGTVYGEIDCNKPLLLFKLSALFVKVDINQPDCCSSVCLQLASLLSVIIPLLQSMSPHVSAEQHIKSSSDSTSVATGNLSLKRPWRTQRNDFREHQIPIVLLRPLQRPPPILLLNPRAVEDIARTCRGFTKSLQIQTTARLKTEKWKKHNRQCEVIKRRGWVWKEGTQHHVQYRGEMRPETRSHKTRLNSVVAARVLRFAFVRHAELSNKSKVLQIMHLGYILFLEGGCLCREQSRLGFGAEAIKVRECEGEIYSKGYTAQSDQSVSDSETRCVCVCVFVASRRSVTIDQTHCHSSLAVGQCCAIFASL